MDEGFQLCFDLWFYGSSQDGRGEYSASLLTDWSTMGGKYPQLPHSDLRYSSRDDYETRTCIEDLVTVAVEACRQSHGAFIHSGTCGWDIDSNSVKIRALQMLIVLESAKAS